jgi:hypothetical protein
MNPAVKQEMGAECVGIGPKVFAKKVVSKASWRGASRIATSTDRKLTDLLATGVFAAFFPHVHVNVAQLLASRSFVITSVHFRGALGGGIRGFFLSHLMVECARCTQQPWRLAVCKRQDGH